MGHTQRPFRGQRMTARGGKAKSANLWENGDQRGSDELKTVTKAEEKKKIAALALGGPL